VDCAAPPSDPVDESERPLVEGGEGEAEGFEQAERELAEHATHSDQHAARRAIQDAPLDEPDDARAADSAEADVERSSERAEDTP
jgi:hypothetical protein